MPARVRTRAFADDADAPEKTAPSDEPEYSFEGFKIEFSEKIALTPVGPRRGAGEKAQVAS